MDSPINRSVLYLCARRVLDSQPRLLVVNMDPGLVREVRNHRSIDVGKSHAGMLGEEVASALFAPFAITVRRLVVGADVVCSARDAHRLGFPESKGVDRPRRPASTRLAVAIAHCRGLTGDRELDRAAKAAALVGFEL